jgi:hypothetical protein
MLRKVNRHWFVHRSFPLHISIRLNHLYVVVIASSSEELHSGSVKIKYNNSNSLQPLITVNFKQFTASSDRFIFTFNILYLSFVLQ